MKSVHHNSGRDEISFQRGPIPFPADRADQPSLTYHGRAGSRQLLPESVDDVLAAFDSMSRRITDLARELNCLGHFDDPNGDLPRAA